MSDERGAASIVVAAVTAAILVLAMGCCGRGAGPGGRIPGSDGSGRGGPGRGPGAGDPDGIGPAETAAEFAGRNGADLVSCSCDPGAFETEVVVRVAVGDADPVR